MTTVRRAIAFAAVAMGAALAAAAERPLITGISHIAVYAADAAKTERFYVHDPDGTRAELMELHAIGKPCCSPFSAKDTER